MTDTPTPARPVVSGNPDQATHRVDIVTDTDPANPFAVVYFAYDDDVIARDLAIAAIVKTGGPPDRYGRLYSHLIGDQASYVDTVSIDDAPSEVIGQREGRAEVVDVGWRVGTRTVKVTMALDITDRDGRAVIADHRGEIGSVDRDTFLGLIAQEFGVIIVPAAERTEIGAAVGCGCPTTAEVDAGGLEVAGTRRIEHQPMCWEAPLDLDPAALPPTLATDAEISYPLGNRYVSNMDVAEPARFAPPQFAVLGAAIRTEVGNTALRLGLTHDASAVGWSQVLHVVLTPAERAQLRSDLAEHAAASALSDGRTETETEYVHVVDGTTFRMGKHDGGGISIDHPAVEAALANLRAAARPVYDRTDPVQVMAARRYAWELDKQVNAGDPAAITRTAGIAAAGRTPFDAVLQGYGHTRDSLAALPDD